MAIGNNLKKGTKAAIPEKQEVQDATVDSSLVPKTETKLDQRDTQSLNQLNHDLEATQQVEENSRMLVVFPVGKEEYAFEIGQIKEVVPVPPISPVPQTKKYIQGVANVRGNVLAVIDLAKKFGLKKGQAADEINYVIVINSEDVKVAVVSSQVPETLMIKESQINSTADVMRKSNNEQHFINGVIKKDNRMIILIDILEMIKSDQD
ncbi:chemotaxis protein CheW [Reichenbachiella carrageenanivorans]|uniref:Chemotaxis protein CheW n=1 Tax=Reichenbachiella carrageenanivorans TaxID=2979869 RepID=A0ABY6D084_9BACT|nr:chemotaxis protein CheW [Reichenbachiella carrageenanivorans]UXX79508.1 chemotaxis protein CheW [Reichenbachiella carrageenanivorans]